MYLTLKDVLLHFLSVEIFFGDIPRISPFYFPFWFLHCFSSEIRFSNISSWSSLLRSPLEPSILGVEREGACLLLSCLPCSASMPSLLTSFSPTSVHTSPFLLKQTTCLLPAGTSFSPPLPMTSLLYVSFTPATSCCHLSIFSIYNLKSIFSIFFPPLPGNAFQSLALSLQPHSLGQLWPAQWLSASFRSGPMGLPSSLCWHAFHAFCIDMTFLITKATDPFTFCRGPRVSCSPHLEHRSWLPVLFRCFCEF